MFKINVMLASYIALGVSVVALNTAFGADRAALVDRDGTVTNIIELKADVVYEPPPGLLIVTGAENARIGGSYRDGQFNDPPAPVPSPKSSPLDRLKLFLATNPDVVEILK